MGRAATRTSTAHRLDASVTDAPTVQKAQRLMAVLDAGNADLFRGALDVLDWCVRQVQEGRHIASVMENGGVARELSTPLLDTARRHNRIVLHTEAFDQVVKLLDRPAQPTPALRDLLAESYAHEGHQVPVAA